MKSRVSSKGQVTLPSEVRERLGLAPGTPVEFQMRKGGVLLVKGHRGSHPVDQLYGRLTLPGPVDDLLDAMRGPLPFACAKGPIRRARRARRSARP